MILMGFRPRLLHHHKMCFSHLFRRTKRPRPPPQQQALGNPSRTEDVVPLESIRGLNPDGESEGERRSMNLGVGGVNLAAVTGVHGEEGSQAALLNSAPGTSTAVAIHDIEQGNHPTSECH